MMFWIAYCRPQRGSAPCVNKRLTFESHCYEQAY